MRQIRFRPIDEELNDLHTPLAVTLSEDDDENDVSILSHGFTVNGWLRAWYRSCCDS
jgi:hypothetical protein